MLTNGYHPQSCVTVINLQSPQNYSRDTRRQRSCSCDLKELQQRFCSTDNVYLNLQVNYGSVLTEEEFPRRSTADQSFILPTAGIFYVSNHHVTSCFFHLLSLSMFHETRRNIMSHHNSRGTPDLWLPTSLQPSLAGQRSGAKAINHTQTIHEWATPATLQ